MSTGSPDGSGRAQGTPSSLSLVRVPGPRPSTARSGRFTSVRSPAVSLCPPSHSRGGLGLFPKRGPVRDVWTWTGWSPGWSRSCRVWVLLRCFGSVLRVQCLTCEVSYV